MNTSKNQRTEDRSQRTDFKFPISECQLPILTTDTADKVGFEKSVKICVICGYIFLCLFAATSALGYCGGDGTPENPYQICDVNSLLELSADVNNYDKNFIMTADINLAGYDFNVAIIASWPRPQFSGKFNGAGHKISNLNINGNIYSGYIGLFGEISGPYGEVSNLGLEDVNVAGYSSVAGLVAYNGGNITNCYSVGIITRRYNISNAGGLVAVNEGDIINCHSGGVVQSDIAVSGSDPTQTGVGGLVGGMSATLSQTLIQRQMFSMKISRQLMKGPAV